MTNDICGLCVTSCFVIGLALPTIYYGFQEEDLQCQEGERGGLNLSDWLKGSGISFIIITGFVIVTKIIVSIFNISKIFYFCTLVLIADILFWIGWVIWGVIIISTKENSKCISQGTNIGILSIVNIIFGSIRFIYLAMFVQE